MYPHGAAARPFAAALLIACLAALHPVRAATPIGAWDAQWDPGSTDCAVRSGPALQVHRYDARTFILREGLCATFEAPFMYLLIGSQKALLIDSGDVADPGKVALARGVLELLPVTGSHRLPLLVVHTHRHMDHRAGDRQLMGLPDTLVVGFDLESVKRFYRLPDWPDGTTEIHLGGRTIEVIPTPGHSDTEVSFYDGSSGLVFSGDFLLPGRILVDDIAAYRQSAARLLEVLHDRPVKAFLGGHIEMDARGQLYDWGSQYHPDERALPMSLVDLQALAAALARFNGFYTESGGFTMVNSIHILIALGALGVAALLGVAWIVVRLLRRRRAWQPPGALAGNASDG